MRTVDRLVIPQVLAQAARLEGREEWLIPLPDVIRQVASQWSLTVGESYQPGGNTAWVAPARGASGVRLVLKVAGWHTEAADEAAGLRAWAGNGTVQLHAVTELGDTTVLLLDRCEPGTPLADMAEPARDRVVAGLLRGYGSNLPRGTASGRCSRCAMSGQTSSSRKPRTVTCLVTRTWRAPVSPCSASCPPPPSAT